MTKAPHYHGHRQRLRDRLTREPKQLADYEVLEMLLGQVIRRGDTKPLAKELLCRFGSIRGVMHADPDVLLDIPGFGPALVAHWVLIQELMARVGESIVQEKADLSSPELVFRVAQERIGHLKTEEFWLLLVDNQNRLTAWERVSQGSVDEAVVYPRDVLRLALKHDAGGIILVHNHPGGNPTPSSEDVQLTRRLARAAGDFGIRLLDHVVVCEDSYYSFQAQGML